MDALADMTDSLLKKDAVRAANLLRGMGCDAAFLLYGNREGPLADRSLEWDGGMPALEAWHTQLLNQMSVPPQLARPCFRQLSSMGETAAAAGESRPSLPSERSRNSHLRSIHRGPV